MPGDKGLPVASASFLSHEITVAVASFDLRTKLCFQRAGLSRVVVDYLLCLRLEVGSCACAWRAAQHAPRA